MAAPVLAAPSAARAEETTASGFHVGDGRLLDANGNDFVMRGVNHAHTWYASRTTQSLRDIKALGANSVRMVLGPGLRRTRNDTTDVASVVSQCRANRLVCVLEAHDTTGNGERSGAATLDQAVDYWLSVKDALQSQEKNVVVNIGNEPYGNSGYSAWTSDTKNAIARLRTAGFDHTLMDDAPNWGQDWSFTMRDNAEQVYAADPDRNTVFSIHVRSLRHLGRSVRLSQPVRREETADRRRGIRPRPLGRQPGRGRDPVDHVPTGTRLSGLFVERQRWRSRILDMAIDFDASQLTSWGQRIFNGTDGIKQTSREACVFSGDGSDGGESPTTGTS